MIIQYVFCFPSALDLDKPSSYCILFIIFDLSFLFNSKKKKKKNSKKKKKSLGEVFAGVFLL
jgi:hypothetical protein